MKRLIAIILLVAAGAVAACTSPAATATPEETFPTLPGESGMPSPGMSTEPLPSDLPSVEPTLAP